MAIDWQSYYNTVSKENQGMYNKQKGYVDNAKAEQTKALETQRDYTLGTYQKERDAGLKNAYTSLKTADKALPQQMAAYGITGGGAQKMYAQQQNAYGQNVNQAYAQYNQSSSDLANQHTTDMAALNAQYAQQYRDLQRQNYLDTVDEARYRQNADEQLRQYAQNYAFQQKQFDTQNAQWQQQYNFDWDKYNTQNAQWQQEYNAAQAQYQQQMALQWDQYNWQKSKL